MRRAVALLAPALARRSAAPAAAALAQPPFAPGGWLRFATTAPQKRGRDEWFNKKGLSAKEISDEITRRWSEGPTPSQASLNALLRRVQTAEEAKLAAKAVERFHGQRCEAGWLTGVGAVSSAEFARACTRAGVPDVAVAMFARAPLVGLAVTPDVCCRLLASTATKDADSMLEAYRKLREAGLQVTTEVARYVLKGLQGPGGGGSPQRALEAALTFESSGVPVGRRAWNSLLCAAAAAVDVATVDGVVAAMTAAKEKPNATAQLALAAAALLKGDAPAAAAAMRAAAALEAETPAKADAKGKAMSSKEIAAEVLARWASGLAKGASTPGGLPGLEARTREALAAADAKLPLDVATLFKGAELSDGPAAPAPAAAAAA